GPRSPGPCRGWPWRGRSSRTRPSGTRCGRRRQHLGLKVEDLGDSVLGQPEEVVELAAAERKSLRRALHLDETPGGRHDDVHVDLGAYVLGVVEVEERNRVDD